MRMDQVPELELTADQQLALVFQQMTDPEGIVPRLARAVFGDGNGDRGMRGDITDIKTAIASRRRAWLTRLGFAVLEKVASVVVIVVGGWAFGVWILGLRISLAAGAP